MLLSIRVCLCFFLWRLRFSCRLTWPPSSVHLHTARLSSRCISGFFLVVPCVFLVPPLLFLLPSLFHFASSPCLQHAACCCSPGRFLFHLWCPRWSQGVGEMLTAELGKQVLAQMGSLLSREFRTGKRTPLNLPWRAEEVSCCHAGSRYSLETSGLPCNAIVTQIPSGFRRLPDTVRPRGRDG